MEKEYIEMRKSKECYDYWKKEKEVVLFCMSHNLRNNFKILNKIVDIKMIVDNDKNLEGTTFETIPINYFDNIKQDLIHYKVIICGHYDEIAAQLKLIGLYENIDFININKYLSMYFWFKQGKCYVNEVHMTITTKCTLNCEKCNMLMPYYKKTENFELDNLKKDIDILFSKVDKVGTFVLLGGEPLLYPHLDELIGYINDTYLYRMEKMEIITNGTLMIQENLISVINKEKTVFRISDYSCEVDYKNRIDEFIQLLECNQIQYIRNISLKWLDFGFPDKPISMNTASLAKHMLDCSPAFKGFNDGKLYFCHIVWSACKCGLIAESGNGYIDFKNEIQKEEIVLYELGIMRNGPIALCRMCAGCSASNQNTVVVAKQKQREEK